MCKTLEQLVLNSRIIDQVEKQIQEASSVLKYSLYLEPIEIKTTKEDFSSLLIEKVNEEVYKNFKPFTNDNTYNIFGCRERYHKNDLSSLDSCYPFWQHVFKQHAILSAYDRLRKIIGQSVELTSYSFCKYSNYTNEDDSFDTCHHGLDYLLGLYGNNICNELLSDKLYLSKKCDFKLDSAKISENSPNYARRIKSLYKKLADLDLHGPITHILESPQAVSLDLLEFYEFSVRRKDNSGQFKMLDILNVYKKKHINNNDYKNYAVSASNIFDTIKFGTTNGIKHKLLTSDRIYLAYKIEKILAPVTINCLYHNIINIEEGSPLKNDYNYIINSCLQLPNVFTRKYILQIAVDMITKHFDKDFEDTYFFTKLTENLDSGLIFMENKDFINTHQKLYFLVNRYKNFIDYMVEIAFPVYENYFFCTLWNSISKSCDSNKATFINFYKKLAIYLNNTENVAKLFDTEKIIREWGGNSINIIKTDFMSNTCDYEKRNTSLYYECLKTLKTASGNKYIPDFINLDYISGNYSGKKAKEAKFKQYARAYIIKSMISS